MFEKSRRPRRHTVLAVLGGSVRRRPLSEVVICGPFNSRGWDVVLFIAAPLVAIGVLIPIARYFPSAGFAGFLLSFFTFGHHLPGFLRAYGDRDLFARHRARFLVAPPVVFLAALWFTLRDLHGLLFVVFTWDIWHVLMQQYGFLRIYDAKAGRVDKLGAWADRAMALSWYLTFKFHPTAV